MPNKTKIEEYIEGAMKEFDESIFDYHIRGCKFIDKESNEICDHNKKELKSKFHTSLLGLLEVVGEVTNSKRMDGGGSSKNHFIIHGYNKALDDIKNIIKITK